MKLNNIFEDKKSSLDKIKKQMIKWCEKNVEDFIEYYHDHSLEPEFNRIYCDNFSIVTSDIELPYELYCVNEFSIKAPNLISFKNFPNIHTQKGELPKFIFEDCEKLNFKDFFYAAGDLIINFYECESSNINPQWLNNNQVFNSLYYIDSSNEDIANIANYSILNTIQYLEFKYLRDKLRNVASIFDTQIESIRIINTACYYEGQEKILNSLFEKYIHLGKDHVMDMVVELTDAGFEDEV